MGSDVTELVSHGFKWGPNSSEWGPNGVQIGSNWGPNGFQMGSKGGPNKSQWILRGSKGSKCNELKLTNF